MAVRVICPQCGHPNGRVSVFCAGCGARMSERAVMRRHDGPSAGRFLGGLVRLLVVLGVALAIGLAVWPLPVAGTVANDDRAEGFRDRLSRTETWIGQDDINNYLAWRVRDTPAAGAQAMRVGLEGVRIELREDRVRAVAVGMWGPVRLTFDIRGLPDTTGGAFRLQVGEARLGHLRLPKPAHGWAAGHLETILSGMVEERKILDGVRRIELSDSRVKLHVAP
jgi:hypothetical protein